MSRIEWTDITWNPVTGCARVSEGCDHCYIERTIPFRIEGRRFDQRGRMDLRVHDERITLPLRWRRPRLVFVNSLSDLFHPGISSHTQAEIFGVMALAVRHTFQVLTKRPAGMAKQVTAWLDTVDIQPPPNIWLGTSIELDKYAWRADHLRATPAAVRWLSLEPLLGPLPSLDLSGIDWVVAGGESGPNARPMHPAWLRDIRDRCVDAGIPFFFKQWGEWAPSDQCGVTNYKINSRRFRYRSHRFAPDGTTYEPNQPDLYAYPGMESVLRVGKKTAGRTLDARIWHQFPSALATQRSTT